MTLLLIVLPASFAVATAALCWRNRRRWRHIRARPVLTCDQVAGLPPGQFVALTGRTSDGPLIKAPYTGRVCVGYRAKVSWHRDVGQNDFESDERVDSRGLPIRVADGTGAVNVSEYLAQRRLLRRRDARLGQVSMWACCWQPGAAAGPRRSTFKSPSRAATPTRWPISGSSSSRPVRLTEAEDLLCRAADAGNLPAVNALGLLLKRIGRAEEAEQLLRSAAAATATTPPRTSGSRCRVL